eukprot:9610114-Heterocapsa_arctica.AAC.1
MKARDELVQALAQVGFAPANSQERPRAIRDRLLQAILRLAGDPDDGLADVMASGVSLGVDRRLPRTPAVFERKTDWALSCAGDEQSKCMWASNYASARLRLDVLLE